MHDRPSPRELAERLIAGFDRTTEIGLARALIAIFRADGFGKFESDESAYTVERAVLEELERHNPEDIPFRLSEGGRRLVGKARVGQQDSPDVIFARCAESIAVPLLSSMLALDPSDFEVVCAAAVRLSGGYDMRALCTGDEGGIDFYGRLEVRQRSDRIPAGILYTTILPRNLLVLGQAKRYPSDSKIGRPDIQKFKGQLDDCLRKYEGNARPPTHRVPESYYKRNESFLGVFATTGSFAGPAITSAESNGIVLVTGRQLAHFLAFQRVGIVEQQQNGFQFDGNEFARWVSNQRQQLV